MTSLDVAVDEFGARLVAAGLLIPAGLPGLYARGEAFEAVVDAVDSAVGRAAGPTRDITPRGAGYTLYRFPPVFSRSAYERTDYIESFPDLTGVVHTFSGTADDHRRLLRDRAADRCWDHHLSPGDTALVSAACHPLYGVLPPSLPERGVAAEVNGYCFRHEPSADPMRMQCFRMHEFVRVGSAADTSRFRDRWRGDMVSLLTSFGLDVAAVPANDPFFGRSGRLLADEQLTNELKTEMVVHVYGDRHPASAIASCNLAGEHFGAKFGLALPDGGTAHTACAAFGLERIALALLATHGLDPRTWSPAVTRALRL